MFKGCKPEVRLITGNNKHGLRNWGMNRTVNNRTHLKGRNRSRVLTMRISEQTTIFKQLLYRLCRAGPGKKFRGGMLRAYDRSPGTRMWITCCSHCEVTWKRELHVTRAAVTWCSHVSDWQARRLAMTGPCNVNMYLPGENVAVDFYQHGKNTFIVSLI